MNKALPYLIGAGILFYLLNKKSNGIGNVQSKFLFSKEFYGLMDSFENNVVKYFYVGARVEREKKELWKIGKFYTNGNLNELFNSFVHGYQLGRINQ